MKKPFSSLFSLAILVVACHAEPRWCSVSKKDPSNTLFYPPIAVAAQVQGEARAVIVFRPNGTVEKVEPVAGPAMLSQSVVNQLSKWIVKTHEPGGELCQTLVVAVFTLHPPAASGKKSKEHVEFSPGLNNIRVTVSRNFPEIEPNSAPADGRASEPPTTHG